MGKLKEWEFSLRPDSKLCSIGVCAGTMRSWAQGAAAHGWICFLRTPSRPDILLIDGPAALKQNHGPGKDSRVKVRPDEGQLKQALVEGGLTDVVSQEVRPTNCLSLHFPYDSTMSLYRAQYPQLSGAEELHSAISGPEQRPRASTGICPDVQMGGAAEHLTAKLNQRHSF